MKIRTHVRLASLLPVLFGLLVGSALWISWGQVDQARQRAATAENIRRAISDLNNLTQEYLLFGSARSSIQLGRHHLNLTKLLESASFPDPAEQALLEDIRQGHADLDRLVALLLKAKQEAHDQLADALMVKVQDVRFKARQLVSAEQEKMASSQRRMDHLVLIALGVLAVLNLGMLVVLGSRLIQGMERLGEGIRRAESGDLDHAVPITGTDELDILARAFNDMTRRLRESTTSIDRLKQEISEREHAEQATRNSEARFRELFQKAPVPLCFVNKNGELSDFNARFEQLFGYSHVDIPTLSEWWQLAYPDLEYRTWVSKAWNEAVEHAASTGQDIIPIEYKVTSKNGTVRTMLISGITLGEDFLATFFDVTERRQAEDEVRRLNADLEQRVIERTAELSAANQELDSFAYAVSHDLRAPLRAMSGFSQALTEDYGSLLHGEAAVYLEQINLASRKMSELIDGLLVLSRSTRGDLDYDIVDISGMADRQLAELAKNEPDRKASLQVESGLLAHGDRRMLEVVMRNLLDNAWKYSAHAAAPEIRLYRAERNGQTFICVADNGAGFDMAHANRLFQPFQRLHRQEEFPGIGIGLATVQRIVHRHGGQIDASGEPGWGAVFCFSLPELAAGAEKNERNTHETR
jgi:PAS domain S-box-containing protein